MMHAMENWALISSSGISSNLCKIRYKCSVFSVPANPLKYISISLHTEASVAVRFNRLTDLLKFRAELKINVFVLSLAEVSNSFCVLPSTNCRQNSLVAFFKKALLRKLTVFTSHNPLPVRQYIKLDDHLSLLSIVNPVAARLFKNGFNLRQLLTFVRDHGKIIGTLENLM